MGLYGIFLGVLILMLVHSPFVIAQEALPVGGNAVNSKYLSIPEHGYRIGDISNRVGSNQIIGTIVNNSTQKISVC